MIALIIENNDAWKSAESWVIILVVLAICVIVAFNWGKIQGLWSKKNAKKTTRSPRNENNLLQSIPAPPLPLPILEVESRPLDVFPFSVWWEALIEKVVHVILVGGTNAGKTYTCKKILDGRINAGHKIVILDPHARKNRDKWGEHAERCIGFGRNFTEIEAFLKVLLQEMSIRYDTEAQSSKLTVVIEETPAISAKCPSWKAFISEMAFEARKIDINLIVIAQSDRVESLGIQGKGDLRDSLSFLRLGAKALQNCPQVVLLQRGGSFQSQELQNGAERAIDLERLNDLIDLPWQAPDFWVPDSIPETAPIMLAGSAIVYGVRTPDELRNGQAREWAVPVIVVPDAVASLGADYSALYSLLQRGGTMTNKQLVEAVYNVTEPTATQCMQIGKMKKKIQLTLDERSDSEEFSSENRSTFRRVAAVG